MPAPLSSLSFFFPAYNEEEHVAAMVQQAVDILPRYASDLEITVVDDGSRDGTAATADALAARHPAVRAVHHARNRGYGAAVRTGLAAATKDFVFYTDGDQQFDIADLGRLIAVLEGADAVVGYRLVRRDPWRRRVIAWVYNRLIRLLFGGGFRDVDCAFKLFRRGVFELVPPTSIRSNGAFFSAELLLTLRAAGLSVRQVGVPHYPRLAGLPKGAPPRVILGAMRDMFALRLRLLVRRPR